MKPTPKQAYALRADAVRILRAMGFTVRELAVIFKTTPEPIRQLAARGERNFHRHPGAIRSAQQPEGKR